MGPLNQCAKLAGWPEDAKLLGRRRLLALWDFSIHPIDFNSLREETFQELMNLLSSAREEEEWRDIVEFLRHGSAPEIASVIEAAQKKFAGMPETLIRIMRALCCQEENTATSKVLFAETGKSCLSNATNPSVLDPSSNSTASQSGRISQNGGSIDADSLQTKFGGSDNEQRYEGAIELTTDAKPIIKTDIDSVLKYEQGNKSACSIPLGLKKEDVDFEFICMIENEEEKPDEEVAGADTGTADQSQTTIINLNPSSSEPELADITIQTQDKDRDKEEPPTKRTRINCKKINFSINPDSPGDEVNLDSDSDPEWRPSFDELNEAEEEQIVQPSYTANNSNFQNTNGQQTQASSSKWPEVKTDPTGSFLCFFCDFKTSGAKGKINIQSHLGRIHRQQLEDQFGFKLSEVWNHQCGSCVRVFESISKLKQHETSHSKDKKFHCGQCEAKFASALSLKHHMRGVHSEGPKYHCKVCSIDFTTLGYLSAHRLRTHRHPNKKFPCTLCKASYSTLNGLKIHIRRLHPAD